MKNFKAQVMSWIRILRMSSEELAAQTLPHWTVNALQLRHSVRRDYIGLIAAGVAFYLLLAAFPMLAAAISLYGLFLDPHDITAHLNALSRFLPKDALKILLDQATALIEAPDKSLGVSLLISILLAVYSASRGVTSLIKGFNIAYDVSEKRGMAKLTLLGYGLTFWLLVYFLMSLTLIAGLPVALQYLALPENIVRLASALRWVMLFFGAIIGLEVLYTFGPCRKRHNFKISAGAVVATILWLAGSSLFSIFVTNFHDYNATYGSLGAVVILMLWFWVSALTILIGAEINGMLEQRHGHEK